MQTNRGQGHATRRREGRRNGVEDRAAQDATVYDFQAVFGVGVTSVPVRRDVRGSERYFQRCCAFQTPGNGGRRSERVDRTAVTDSAAARPDSQPGVLRLRVDTIRRPV